ncbi:MAG TPA: hypothetical protein VGB69_10225 [Edaphobacter sp.]
MDHYEPLCQKATVETGIARVARWQEAWPRIADAAPRDAAGRPPCYSFFYPQEEYRPELLAPLAEMTRQGIGDVEVHIHHYRETAENFIRKITEFCGRLRNDHGLLHDHRGKMVFGFIHGNWALDNSLPGGKDCGLTGEIELLRDLGCYADFTMPSLPSPSQGSIVNQIYWCTGTPGKPKAYDRGIEATAGGGSQGDLLMITGPVGLRFAGRLIPRVEMGEIAHNDLPTPYRVRRWIDVAPMLGEDIFLKLHTHGAREDNADALLGTQGRAGGLEQMFRWLHEETQRQGIELRWASAYDMFCAVEEFTGPLYPGSRLPVTMETPAGAS